MFAFHHDVINYPRKLHFILLAKMRVIRAAFDPFFSTPLSLQQVVKCDKLILKYVLLCQEQVSPIWLAFPPQELGIVYLRIWHPAFLSGEIEKCPPDDTTALSIESSELVPYLNIYSNNWTLSTMWKVQFSFLLWTKSETGLETQSETITIKYISTQRIPFGSQVPNFSGVLKHNLWYICGNLVG